MIFGSLGISFPETQPSWCTSTLTTTIQTTGRILRPLTLTDSAQKEKSEHKDSCIKRWALSEAIYIYRGGQIGMCDRGVTTVVQEHR